MNKTAEQTLIAILIERLGGEVKITREEFFRADELEVTEWDDPVTLTYKLTAKRPPEILTGEVVESGPQEIEPPQLMTANGWITCPPDGPDQ